MIRSAARRALKRALGPERFHERFPDELRAEVGGQWEEMGRLQLEYLKAEGLKPHHDLLDVGCGVLRADIPLMRYLEPARYCGLDASEEMLVAASAELRMAGLTDRRPVLLHTSSFEAERFGRKFDYTIAQSLFTHISLNDINVCLLKMAHVLKPSGRFYATFFENPHGTRSLAEVQHEREDGPPIPTFPAADPYHYGRDAFEWLVEGTDLQVRYIKRHSRPASIE